MEELFYHPESYDCMAFDNDWDAGAMGTTCGYFVPIYQNLDGFIDDDGNSEKKKQHNMRRYSNGEEEGRQ